MIGRFRALAIVASVVAAASVVAGAPAAHADDCIKVDMAVQLNQFPLVPDLAKRFNDSDLAHVGDRCVEVSVAKQSSGAAATLLEQGWPNPEKNGPKPVVWSPASTAWAKVLNERLTVAGERAMAPDGEPIMISPLVIAMPKPMAEVLGWPNTPIGFSDILALARDPNGWASKGHPEWGAFKLGKTNPNFSTSGLSSLMAQYYAFTGDASGALNLEDADQQAVVDQARSVESSVVHYGDTTLTFLNNWYRADRRGSPYSYASAVAVEEQSVVNYNKGNPDGKLDPGEKLIKPDIPLVGIYPKEGTLFSDNPYVILDAKWVDANERAAARKFLAFVQRPENQRLALQSGFRPGNPAVAIGAPIDAAHGLDAAQPQSKLEYPDAAVVAGLIDRWGQVRKGARVLLVVDVSGSMADPGDAKTGASKLDLAVKAATSALEQFQPEDQVGLWTFSSGIGPDDHPDYRELARVAPIGSTRDTLVQLLANLEPTSGTPLFDVTRHAYDAMHASYDGSLINAVIVLSDGQDDPGGTGLADIRKYLGRGEGEDPTPVRVFSIAYGADADMNAMRVIAESTNGAFYDATDPTTIIDVLNAVVSNF